MKRFRLIVDGDVTGVRYRDYVQKTALKHKLHGSVENMKDRTVEIICEGGDKNIHNFIEELKDAEGEGRWHIEGYPNAEVNKVQAIEEKSTGKFTTFEIKHGSMEEELGDQMGASYNILLDYASSIRKIDEKYGVISVNMEASAKAITLLSGTLTKLNTTLEDDRKAMKSDREMMKNLAEKIEKSIAALSSRK